MNAISTLTILPRSKTEIGNYVELIKQDILSGYINPLESALMIKAFEDILKALKDDAEIKAYINKESDKYTEKTIDFHGAKITKQDRPKYDFSVCDDAIWNLLQNKLLQTQCEIKGRENWLKTIKEPTCDTDTGQMINPPSKQNTSILSITLKK